MTTVIIFGLVFMSICCTSAIVGVAWCIPLYFDNSNNKRQKHSIMICEFISTTVLFIYLFYDLLIG